MRHLLIPLRALAKTILILGLMVATIFGLIIARLLQGPVSLEDYSPHIQKALQRALPQADVTFHRPQLVWGGLSQPLEITVEDVDVQYHKNMELRANARQLGVHLEWLHLLIGQARIKSLRLSQPVIQITGDIYFPDASKSSVSPLSWLPSGSKPKFKELVIEKGQVTFQAPQMKAPLVVENVDLDLYRKRFGIH
ncbi:MAG: hypothetical protein ACK5VW_02080, partial [Holosporales bacterium]